MNGNFPLVADGFVLLAVGGESRSGWKLSRVEGELLVLLYAGYTVILAMR